MCKLASHAQDFVKKSCVVTTSGNASSWTCSSTRRPSWCMKWGRRASEITSVRYFLLFGYALTVVTKDTNNICRSLSFSRNGRNHGGCHRCQCRLYRGDLLLQHHDGLGVQQAHLEKAQTEISCHGVKHNRSWLKICRVDCKERHFFFMQYYFEKSNIAKSQWCLEEKTESFPTTLCLKCVLLKHWLYYVMQIMYYV